MGRQPHMPDAMPSRSERVDTGLATLTDRLVFPLKEPQWSESLRALDAPPKDNRLLRALLQRKPAWEA